MVVDRLAKRHSVRLSRSAFEGKKCEISIAGRRVLLLKPMTFMNESGRSVYALIRRRHMELDKLLVVVDDMALSIGTLRVRQQGGAGGHKGLASIIRQLQTDRFARLRVGIGASPGPEWQDFVLSPFDEDEYDAIGSVLEAACDACETWLLHGVERTMNLSNKTVVSHDPTCASSKLLQNP